MTNPVRLLESSPNPAARGLLQAGLRERPRPSALRSTALALGLGGSVVAASATATAGTAVVAVPFVAPSLTLMVSKWVALGVLGGLALAGGASLVIEPAEPKHVAMAAHHGLGEPARAATHASPAPAPPVSSLDLQAPTATPTAPALPGRPAASPTPRPEAPRPLPAAPARASLPNAQSLSREIAMIDACRRALSSGDAAAALAQLDEYAASPRTGTLDREAQLLRIDSLSLSGQRAAALALAERYLASYPNDPHAARLRELGRAP
jgi:hypothetical protein